MLCDTIVLSPYMAIRSQGSHTILFSLAHLTCVHGAPSSLPQAHQIARRSAQLRRWLNMAEPLGKGTHTHTTHDQRSEPGFLEACEFANTRECLGIYAGLFSSGLGKYDSTIFDTFRAFGFTVFATCSLQCTGAVARGPEVAERS